MSRAGYVGFGLVLGAVLCMGFRHIETAEWRASLAQLEAKTTAHDSLNRVKDDSLALLRATLAVARTDDSVATAQLVPVDTLREQRDSAADADTVCAPAILAATEPLLVQLDARDVVIDAKERAIRSYDQINAILMGQLVTERTLRYEWQHRAQRAPVRGQRGIYASGRAFVELREGDAPEPGAGATLTWRTATVHPYLDLEWRRGEARRTKIGGSVEVKLF